MKLSQNDINEYITHYLNDMDEYYDVDEEKEIAHTLFESFQNQLNESEQPYGVLIKEKYNTASNSEKQIIKDFLTYIKHI